MKVHPNKTAPSKVVNSFGSMTVRSIPKACRPKANISAVLIVAARAARDHKRVEGAAARPIRTQL